MKVIDGGQPQLSKGHRVLVDNLCATAICTTSKTHVYRGMISVRFPDGFRASSRYPTLARVQ